MSEFFEKDNENGNTPESLDNDVTNIEPTEEKEEAPVSPLPYDIPSETKIEYSASPVKEKKKVNGWAICCAALALALCLCGAFMAGYFIAPSGPVEAPGQEGGNQDQTPPREEAVFYHAVEVETVIDENSVAGVAAKVSDSVVEITTESVQLGSYFQEYVSSGAGSGVILTENGYVVTNTHVISGADTITVRLSSGDEFVAEVIGSDSQSDIALLKIDAQGLTPAIIGNSDSIVVGEDVVAIGNPLGELGGTVTDGIISALGREVTIEGETMKLLQTNAAVNPGNSGGGLFNMRGELIGIVNAKSSGSSIEGLGFAIPSNEAYEVVTQLYEFGYVRGRVTLGLDLVEITNSTMAYYYRVNALGLYISGSEYNSELRSGDRIISLDGTEITAYADYKGVLSEHEVGDSLKMVVVRGGKTIEVEVYCYEQTPENVGIGSEAN